MIINEGAASGETKSFITSKGFFSFRDEDPFPKLGQGPLARTDFAPLSKPKVLVVTWPLLSFLERFSVKLPAKDMNLKIIIAVLTGCHTLGYIYARSHSTLNPQGRYYYHHFIHDKI